MWAFFFVHVLLFCICVWCLEFRRVLDPFLGLCHGKVYVAFKELQVRKEPTLLFVVSFRREPAATVQQ